jgi:hypothetical protein
MIISWIPGSNGTEIIFEQPTYTALQPDFQGKIPVDHITTVSPNQDGETRLESPMKPRDTVQFTFIINADTPGELETLCRNLSRAFSPQRNEGTLKVAMDDDTTLYLDAVVKEGYPLFQTGNNGRSGIGAGLSNYWQKATIVLIAHSPWWYADTESIRLVPWIGATIPLEIPWELGSYSDSNIIDNTGDLQTPVKISIEGPVVNPVITRTYTDPVTNTDISESIAVTKSLVSGQLLYIESAFGNIKCEIRNTSTNVLIEDAFQYASIDSVFFWLKPGDNIILYESDDSNDNAALTLQYQPRYSAA